MPGMGDRIKEARKRAGVSQIDLAKAVDMSQQALSMLERGDTGSSKKLVDIAEALNVSAHWLANGRDLDALEKRLQPIESGQRDLGIDVRLAALESELRVIREMSSRILLEVIAMRSELKADKGTDR